MQITRINSTSINYKNKTPIFKSSSRVYNIQKNGNFSDSTIRNTTNLFREDIDWLWLARYIGFNFKDKQHVNIQNLACSDGSEVYTLAIAFDQIFSQREANKFFPIIASDSDEKIINNAKKRRINLDASDFYRLRMFTNGQEYFTNPEPALYIDNEQFLNIYKSYKPTKRLMSSVSFAQKDIKCVLEGLKDTGNTVVLCRNVMPYLSDDYLKNVSELLSSKLKPESMFVLGGFDKCSNFKNMLPNNFKTIIKDIVYVVK